jgi:molybdopterin synthase catalytic subunit
MSDVVNVRVRFFASLRQAAGAAEIERRLPAGSTVASLLRELSATYPGLPAAAGAIYAAVNRAYVDAGTELADGDEVALFPPVSGGQQDAPRLFEIITAPLSLDEVAARVAGPDRGAITVFAGVVRGETGDLRTDHLEYEAYAEMAEPMLADIGAEVQQRWPQVQAISIVHRVGRLEVGEPSVVIAVAAAHRAGTFDACSYAIERLKAIVPIWKKEVGSDGQWWVEGPRGNSVPPVAGSP